MAGAQHIRPRMLSIITTYRCTASCEDCCLNCNPSRRERLTLAQIANFIKQAKSDYPDIKRAVITGGECFTLGEDLYQLVQLLRTYDYIVRIVTNGFWASSMTKAKRIVLRLKSLGVSELNFSTGDCHQRWVPIDNIINAVECAIEVGIPIVINIETHKDFQYSAKQFYMHPRLVPYIGSPLLKVVSGLWIKSPSDGDCVDVMTPNAPNTNGMRCINLFDTITLSPQNEILCCCGLTSLNHQYINLGCLSDNNLGQLWEKQFEDFIKIWLFTEGPEKILSFAKYHDATIDTENSYEHLCKRCLRVLSNPKVLEVLRGSYKSVLPRVLIEYSTYVNVINKLKNKGYEKEKKCKETDG